MNDRQLMGLYERGEWEKLGQLGEFLTFFKKMGVNVMSLGTMMGTTRTIEGAHILVDSTIFWFDKEPDFKFSETSSIFDDEEDEEEEEQNAP
jgi:hypothetical protein